MQALFVPELVLDGSFHEHKEEEEDDPTNTMEFKNSSDPYPDIPYEIKRLRFINCNNVSDIPQGLDYVYMVSCSISRQYFKNIKYIEFCGCDLNNVHFDNIEELKIYRGRLFTKVWTDLCPNSVQPFKYCLKTRDIWVPKTVKKLTLVDIGRKVDIMHLEELESLEISSEVCSDVPEVKTLVLRDFFFPVELKDNVVNLTYIDSKNIDGAPKSVIEFKAINCINIFNIGRPERATFFNCRNIGPLEGIKYLKFEKCRNIPRIPDGVVCVEYVDCPDVPNYPQSTIELTLRNSNSKVMPWVQRLTLYPTKDVVVPKNVGKVVLRNFKGVPFDPEDFQGIPCVEMYDCPDMQDLLGCTNGTLAPAPAPAPPLSPGAISPSAPPGSPGFNLV